MKQHISKEQLSELSEEQREKLEKLLRLVDLDSLPNEEDAEFSFKMSLRNSYIARCCTIGKMIYILHNKMNEVEICKCFPGWLVWVEGNRSIPTVPNIKKYNLDELADCLFSAVKEVL